MNRLCRIWMLLGLLSLTSAGCCCVQGVSTCDNYSLAAPHAALDACDCGSCNPGLCGSGPLLNILSCRGGCGEVYVDEWVSEPPCIDNCGYACGGCGNCQECQPIRNALRLLCGIAYKPGCCAEFGGSGCDGGCGGGGYQAGGHGYDSGHLTPGTSPMAPQPIPVEPPMEVAPQSIPEPKMAPDVSSTSASRLNPARRRGASQASFKGRGRAAYQGGRGSVRPAVYR